MCVFVCVCVCVCVCSRPVFLYVFGSGNSEQVEVASSFCATIQGCLGLLLLIVHHGPKLSALHCSFHSIVCQGVP